MQVYTLLQALVCATTVAFNSAQWLRQRSSCTVETSAGVFTLQPLVGSSPVPRFSDVYGSKNYSFHPCSPFNLPSDLFSTNGHPCRAVSLCAHTLSASPSFQTLGLQSTSWFSFAENSTNVTRLHFRGLGSARQARPTILLKCDPQRRFSTDARFRVLSDDGRGNMVAELSSVCCCPDGCVSRPKVSKKDLILMLAQIGIHLFVIAVAIVVGFFCYHRRNYARSKPYTPAEGDELEEEEKSSNCLCWRKRTANRTGSSSSLHVLGTRPELVPILRNPEIPEKRLSIVRRLGGGVYGDTYLAEWKGSKVALKRLAVGIHQNQFTAEIVQNLIEYTARLSTHRHKYVMATLGICVEVKQPFIVNEYLQGQSLRKYLEDQQLGPSALVKFCRGIAEGMRFLHSRTPPILHRDLRCANVLVNDKDAIKLVDFGVIRMIQAVRELCTHGTECFCAKHRSACPASVRWTAPEVLRNSSSVEEPEPACDVFSFSMCAIEMLTSLDPFSGIQEEDQVLELIVSGYRPELPSTCLPQFRHLIVDAWSDSAPSRPSFNAICERLKELSGEARSYERKSLLSATSSQLRRSTATSLAGSTTSPLNALRD